MKIVRSLFRTFAIDLGSENTRIWVDGKGLVLEAPTCLVVTSSGEVLATGKEALEIADRQSNDLEVIWPIQQGRVADSESLLTLLKIWLKPYFKPVFLIQPTMLVSVPAETTLENRSAIRSLLQKLGAIEVITIAQPLASAIGSGVRTADATGSFFLHLGAGVVEGGVISLGTTMVVQQSLMGGTALSVQLRNLLLSEYELLVDGATLTKVQEAVFSFIQQPDERKLEVLGKDATTRKPTTQIVSVDKLEPITEIFVSEYVELLYRVLQQTPAALLVDSLDKGLLLSGGLAQQHGLDQRLSDEFAMPVSVVDDPHLTVISGMSQVIANLDDFRKSLSYHRDPV